MQNDNQITLDLDNFELTITIRDRSIITLNYPNAGQEAVRGQLFKIMRVLHTALSLEVIEPVEITPNEVVYKVAE